MDDRQRIMLASAVAATGAGLAAIGAFLPWMTLRAPLVGEISKSGLEGSDGLFTLLLALGAAGVIGWGHYTGWTMAHRPSLFALAGLAGAVVAIVAILDMRDVGERVDAAEAQSDLVIASIGEGLYLTLLGGIGLAVGGAVGAFSRR